MTFDIPHMIAAALIIFAVLWGLDRTAALEEMSKGKQVLIKFGLLFAALLLLNIFWPYGSGA